MIMDALLVATTATTGTELFDSFKLKRIEVWGPPFNASSGTVSTVSVAMIGETATYRGGALLTKSDTAMGLEPAYVSVKPPKDSFQGMWQRSGDVKLFNLAAPVGSIVDVTVSLRTDNQSVAVGCANALAGATAGNIYYRGLDGLASASTSIPSEFLPAQ